MPHRRGPLAAVLVVTMVASTFQIFALGVLASPIIDDLEISRATLGLIGAVNTGIGALTAPFSGRMTDRIGPRRAVLVLLSVSAVGMAVMAIAHSPWILLVSGVVSGLPQGWGNPATNALIATTVEPGGRGTITGIKQSGVTLAIVLAGATLPWLAGVGDWRQASGVFAVAFAVFTVVAWLLLPAQSAMPVTTGRAVSGRADPLPSFITRIAVFAFLMGVSSGAIGRFLALYAEEELGYSLTVAGAAVALSGGLGMIFRILAARAAERSGRPAGMLVTLAGIGIGSCILLALASSLGAWLLWPAVVLYALGHTAWNAVANLAVIMSVPTAQAGRASGLVIMGFLAGLSIASPLTGVVVDEFGTYDPAWWGGGVLAFLAIMALAPVVRTGSGAASGRGESA